MKIKKYFMKDKKLYLKKSRTLGALIRQLSTKGWGDFMQLFVLRSLPLKMASQIPKNE